MEQRHGTARLDDGIEEVMRSMEDAAMETTELLLPKYNRLFGVEPAHHRSMLPFLKSCFFGVPCNSS